MIKARHDTPAAFEDLAAPDVNIRVTSRLVEVQKQDDEGDRNPYFNAYILDSDPYSVNFGIRTKMQNGERDPYFRIHPASELARRAILYFESNRPIRGINFSWAAPVAPDDMSDNYDTYVEARNALQQEGMLPEVARVEAAYRTWTVQKIALPNGFTRIDDVFETESPFAGNGADRPVQVLGTIWKQ